MPRMKIAIDFVGQPLSRLGNLVRLLFAVFLLVGNASTGRASDPNGIYAFVDRVVFEPSDAAPERIQVWGGFALAKGGRGGEYNEAARGYMYFKLRAGDEDICKKEWADLKAVAGTSQTVAFGSRYEKAAASLRKADAKIENPDTHPKSWGMTKVRERDYGPVSQLKKLQIKKSDAPAPPESK